MQFQDFGIQFWFAAEQNQKIPHGGKGHHLWLHKQIWNKMP